MVRGGSRAAKLPLAPPAGAVNVTSAPGTLLPNASVTVTASAIEKRVPAWVDSAAAMPGVIVAGLPARSRSAKCAMPVVVAAVAVAVNAPATLPAVNAGEAAMPWMPVIAVAALVPPAKLAPAPAPAPLPPAAQREGHGGADLRIAAASRTSTRRLWW